MTKTKETYKLPVWMHKYAQMIGGKGETVEAIEWYIQLSPENEQQFITLNIYKAKIELLEELHKKNLI